MCVPGKVVYIPPLVLWKKSLPMQDHRSADSGQLYLRRELKLLTPGVKG